MIFEGDAAIAKKATAGWQLLFTQSFSDLLSR